MRYLFLLPAFLWSVMILYVTLIPGKDVPEVNISDKLIHFGVFAGLLTLTYSGLLKEGIGSPLRKAIIYSLLMGIVTECLQMFIPGRSFSYFDLIANIAGILVPVLFIRKLRSRL